MVIVDTNVISEMMRPSPNARIRAWLGGQPTAGIYTSSITEAELRPGAEILPRGERRDSLITDVNALMRMDFASRILAFDSAAAQVYAEIAAARRSAGRPISHSDAQIAAIARSRGMALATRNTRDLEGCGVTLIDPWTA